MPTAPPRIVNAYVDRNDTQVVLVCRDEENRRSERRVVAEWVTYFVEDELDERVSRMVRTSAHTASYRREPGGWLRVSWKSRSARQDITLHRSSPLVQLGVRMFESDVDPVRRLITDSGIQIGKPRRVFLDIETDSRVSFAHKDEMRVLSWALVDQEGNRQLDVLEEESDAAERRLLVALWEALEPYDQVVAWSGDNFDFPVIWSRTDQRGISVDARKWLWLDHLDLFKRMNMHSAESGAEKQSMKLESIAQEVVGEGKEKPPAFVRERFGDKSLGALAWQLWEAGGEYRRLLARYNLRDTDLLRRIEKETGYIDLFQTLCESCNIFGDSKGINPTHQMDGFMLRLGKERHHHFATKVFREGNEQFKGAFVMPPRVKGIERAVHVCDFASLYPSIILTLNMSPDTKQQAPINGPIAPGCCRAPTTGITFSVTEHGILTTALRELLRLRKHWNDVKASLPPGTPEWHDADRKSTAAKVNANSFYGVVGSPFSRYFDRQVAESVTQTGRWLLELVIAAAEQRGWKALYGDTDSVFVQGCSRAEFKAFVEWCNTDVFPERLRAQGCVENHIKLAYEKEFDILVMTSAKRYAGRYSHFKGKDATAESKPEIKGLEWKRGDASLLARQLQGETIDLLCGGLKLASGPTPTQELERFHAVVSRARAHVLEDPLTNEEIVLSKSLSKSLKEYIPKSKKDGSAAAQPPHVQIAHQMKEKGLEVGEGTRIEYVVVDGSAAPMKIVSLEEYDGEAVDRHYVWESLVYPPTLRLLQAAFPEQDWERWAKSRPPKPRGRSRVLPGQLPFPDSAPMFKPTPGPSPLLGEAKRARRGIKAS